MAVEMREDANASSRPPVNVTRLARNFGCEVVMVDFSPDTVSARIQRHTSAAHFDYLLEVNAFDFPQRQRFSIAHELSHAVLHDDPARDFEFIEDRKPLADYDKPDDMYKEVQANMLAAALLMPEQAVRREWARLDDIDDLADIFDTSRDSAYWRLNNLKLLVNG
ncbi:uncharacterized protein DUF955 [Frondihabitans sp. PhB153]|nr:uncharacterized protein DUF955 [Frondihabitans sp. PhB153]